MRKFVVNTQNIEADIEELHKQIVNEVKAGKYETHMEALAAYMETNDIDMNQMSTLISPALKDIVYNEAIVLNLVSSSKYPIIPEELF